MDKRAIVIETKDYTGDMEIDFKVRAKLTSMFIKDKSLYLDNQMDSAIDFEHGLLCYSVHLLDSMVIINLLDYITTIV